MVDSLMPELRERLAGELSGAGKLLENLAVKLCEDPVVFARHAGSLQHFDEIAQTIGEIAGVLRYTGTPAEAVAAIRLQAMRDRITSGDV